MARAVNINRSKVFEDTVQKLCTNEKFTESNATLFPTIRELLSFCALLGYSEGRKVPLDRTAGVEDIAGAQYEHHEALEILWSIGVAHTNSTDILKDGNEKECAEIFEEYANGGLTILSEWLEASPDLPSHKAIQSGMQNSGYLSSPEEEFRIDADKIEF